MSSIIHTLSRRWKFRGQTPFSLGRCLLLLEFHQAVRLRKLHLHGISKDSVFGSWSLTDIPSMHILHPIQAPATFRLALGTDTLCSEECTVVGRKMLPWWHRVKVAAEGGKWTKMGNWRSYNVDVMWIGKQTINSALSLWIGFWWFYSCVGLTVYSLINAEQLVHALNIPRTSDASSYYTWSSVFLGNCLTFPLTHFAKTI